MKPIAVLVLSLVSFLPEGVMACKEDDPCEPTSSSQYGNPVKLSPKELRKRLIHCEQPRLPGTLDAQGTVLVQLLVTPKGRVGCAKIIHGHTLLKEAVIVAVKEWTFRPLMVKGKPVPVLGVVGVFVSWDFEKMRKHCRRKT